MSSAPADEVTLQVAHAKDLEVNQLINRALAKKALQRMDLDKTTDGKTQSPTTVQKSAPPPVTCTSEQGKCTFPPCDCPDGNYEALQTSGGDVCYTCSVVPSTATGETVTAVPAQVSQQLSQPDREEMKEKDEAARDDRLHFEEERRRWREQWQQMEQQQKQQQAQQVKADQQEKKLLKQLQYQSDEQNQQLAQKVSKLEQEKEQEKNKFEDLQRKYEVGQLQIQSAEGKELPKPSPTPAPAPSATPAPASPAQPAAPSATPAPDLAVLAASMGAVVLTGVAVTMAKTPAGQRTPAAMLSSLNTRYGYLPFHKVVVPNIVPALTTALVAIPLSLALGIATGTTPMIGIATAVFGGLCGGAFGSSAFNIVGPAGALVGILARYSQTYGPEILPWLSLASAVLIWVTVLLGLQDYCLFMNKAVFEGFTMSVALTIGLGQMNFGFGLTPLPPVPIPGIAPQVSGLVASLKAFQTMQSSTTWMFLIGVVALFLMYRLKPSIPWIVPFAAITALFGYLCDPNAEVTLIPLNVPTLKAKYGILQFQLATSLKPITEIIRSAENGSVTDYLMGAFSVSLVAVMETLISAKIAATRAKFAFDNEQELQGLALAHAACGFCGLMPPSGVFVRTATNLSSGATHKISQFMQGLWVLLLASICMPALSYLPQFAVAAILVVASIRMVPWQYIGQLWCEHRWHFCLWLLVSLVCWVISSVSGLLLGTALVLLVTGKATAKGHAEIAITADSIDRITDALAMDDASFIKSQTLVTSSRHSQVYIYKFLGQLDFLNGDKNVDRLQIVAGTRPTAIVISMENVAWIDPDGVQSLRSIVEMLETGYVAAFIAFARPKVLKALEKEAWHQKLVEMKRVFPSVEEALLAANT